MQHLSSSLLALAALALPAAAQSERPWSPSQEATLQTWRTRHGQSWNALVDRSTHHLELLYGGSAAPVFAPDPAAESDWFALARHWVGETEELHGVSAAELLDERFVYLPLGQANGTDKITVRLVQALHGLPVEGAAVNALFDTRGRLLSLHSTAAPWTDGLSAVPTVSEGAATRAAVRAFESEHGVPALEVGAAELIFAQVELGGARQVHLAWQVSVHNPAVPAGEMYTVDARTGGLLRRDDEVHYCDVKGTIQSMATPGLESDRPANPPVPMNMSYIRLSSSAGTIETDTNGFFNYVGVNSPLNITVTYVGPFNNVNNQAGADYTITFNNVQPNIDNTLLMNPSPTEFVTGQANCFQHVNVLRDYVRSVNPGDSTADFQALSNANIASTCNAYFDGGSVNFFRSGGGCYNTGFSTVVAHEMGHWLNVLYGTGNGPDGMGEGNADVFAMFTYDDPIVARFFFTNGGFIRTGENTRQFCGDDHGGCYGEVHNDGEVWMGAAWKVHRNLQASLGDALGAATADQLFMGWMNAYNQTQIKSIIETQWLTLDDDDGNLDNGTPNFLDIDSGFREQGFPGADAPIVFTNVTDLPDVPSDQGPYAVSADITTLLPPITEARVHWRVEQGAWQDAAMAPAGGDTWAGAIPSIGGAGHVDWYLTAVDSAGSQDAYPAEGANAPFSFTVGVEVVLAAWDFEATGDQGWTSGATGDTATDGFWERGDPNGTDAQPEDDHTPSGTTCWFTGQGSVGGSNDEADVDAGKTSLTTPVSALSGQTLVEYRFWRWYSKEVGGPNSLDLFTTQLSFDGGATWKTILDGANDNGTGGWFERTVKIEKLGVPTDQMQLRLIASDLGADSVIEAAIDDVRIVTLKEQDCASAATYCNPASGSSDNVATIGIDSCSLSGPANLSLAGAPAGQFAYALIGNGNAKVTDPPGALGDLCVAGGSCLGRYSKDVGQTSGAGTFSLELSNTLSGGPNFGIPTCGGNIQSGETWNFQFWHRNPMGAPAGFSEAIAITFQQ